LQDIGAHLPDITKRWQGVIAATRKVFSGFLAASVNGGSSGPAVLAQGYWEDLDYIGVDTFPYLGGDTIVSVAKTRAMFENLLAALEPLVTRTGKKLLFTQIGYPSCDHCGEKNALYNHPEINEQCQCNTYQGILEAVWNSPLVAGLYWWNWLPCADPSSEGKYCKIGHKDNGETVQGKGAQDVVAAYYGGRSSVGSCSPTPAPSPGANCTRDEGFSYKGNDIAKASAASAEECCDGCCQHAACNAWTYYAGTCYFKNQGTVGRKACDACTSGVLQAAKCTTVI